MARYRKVVEFDKDYLNKISIDDKACVSIVKMKKHLHFHPFHLNDMNESIKDILSRSVAKYKKDLNGIVLGYQNVSRMGNVLKSRDDEVFNFLEIEAEFFVFKPEVGQVLQGIVNKIGKDHIGCLVHRTFNVSLLRNKEDDNWCGNHVKVGYEIQFQITYTKLDERLPYIRAEFVSLVNGEDGCVDRNNRFLSELEQQQRKFNFKSEEKTRGKIEVSGKYKKEKKHKNKTDKGMENLWTSQDTSSTSILEENEATDNKKKKKSKKRKRDSDEEVDVNRSEHKTKKKKETLDNSLSDLDLNDLFSSVSNSSKKNTFANSISERTFVLPVDSDLEKIISDVSINQEIMQTDKPKKKRKL